MIKLRVCFTNVLAISVATLAAACSSPPTAGECPEFRACGGVLSGRWDAESFCVNGDPEKPKNAELGTPECRNFYASVSFENVVSTLTFSPGERIAGSIKYWSTSEVELTSDCSLALKGFDVTPDVCTSLTEELKTTGWDQSLECSGTSVCYCSARVEHTGATIIFDDAGGGMMGSAGETVGYCVKGERLTVVDRSQGIDVYVNYRRVQ